MGAQNKKDWEALFCTTSASAVRFPNRNVHSLLVSTESFAINANGNRIDRNSIYKQVP